MELDLEWLKGTGSAEGELWSEGPKEEEKSEQGSETLY